MARTKKTTEETVPEKKASEKNAQKRFILATGRRRSAIARVRLYPKVKDVMWGEHSVKPGDAFVNGKPLAEYFASDAMKKFFTQPLRLTNTYGTYAVTIVVNGGGVQGQLEACVHGIARGLAAVDVDNFRPILKKNGLLTRDSRIRERRKVGMGGKARRKKQSPKR